MFNITILLTIAKRLLGSFFSLGFLKFIQIVVASALSLIGLLSPAKEGEQRSTNQIADVVVLGLFGFSIFLLLLGLVIYTRTKTNLSHMQFASLHKKHSPDDIDTVEEFIERTPEWKNVEQFGRSSD